MTELGIVIEIRLLQLLNASFPIEMTELGMMVLLQPIISVLVSTIRLSSPVQPENDSFPIEVTDFGIFAEVNPLQCKNA